MERFQRVKYLGQIAELRRTMAHWVATYRTIQLAENAQRFTANQIHQAELREDWCAEMQDRLEQLEDMLGDPAEQFI
jgi:hypothetical protein